MRISPLEMKPRSLRAKLIMLIGLAILPLALLEYHDTMKARARVEVRVGADALRLARLVAAHQSVMLESARQLLMTLAEVDCIRDGRTGEGCHAFLRKLHKVSPVYTNIGVIHREGLMFATTSSQPDPSILASEPFLEEVLSTRKWRVLDEKSARLLSPTPALILVYPVEGSNGEFAGVVFVALSLEWEERYEMNVAMPPDTVVATVNQEARVLSHSPDPERWVGRQIRNPGVMEAILSSGDEEGWVTTREHGRERIYGVVPLHISDSAPIYVCVGINRMQTVAPYMEALRRQIGWSLLIGTVALGTAWLVGSLFMVRPARHLVEVAQSAAQGVAGGRSTLSPGAGEFYDIGTAVNQMADAADLRVAELHEMHEKLRHAHDELEERVVQRTAALQRARERLVDAIGTLDAAFVMFDRNDRLRVCNEPFRQVFSHCHDFIRPGVTFEQILREFFDRGGKVLGVDETEKWIATRLALFHRAAGKAFQARINGRWITVSDHRMRDGGIVSLRSDVTDEVLAHQELERRAAELRRSNEELEQFAYVVSHDLQEPLRMVASYTGLLTRRYGEQLDDKARDFLRYAEDGARRMQDFIDALLRYSRVSKRLRPFRRVSMKEVVTRALENLRYAREEKHAAISVGDLPEVMGDEVQLTQLFQNLISNAMKFSGPNPLEIKIGAVPEGGEWVFSVSDNGLGLNEDDADRVFVIFQRLHAGEVEVGGTGIGLAICKKIVERHGGEIRVKSRPGEGATFYFTIPFAQETTGEGVGTDSHD